MEKVKILGFGEVMLRLCPPGFKRLRQCLPGSLDATFGGGEANVCASVAIFGSQSSYLTALPDNPISESFLAQMRGLGVDVSNVLLKRDSRMGVYFVEAGANQRASNVIYDRDHSAIATSRPDDYDFDAALKGIGHLHLTGITPALSENAFLSTLELAKRAKKSGVRVSCDLNYRKKLWNWNPAMRKNELAAQCMSQLMAFVDIVIANEEDAADVFGIHARNTAIGSGKIDCEAYKDVALQLAARFPNISMTAITLRESVSASHNNWGAMLYDHRGRQAYLAPLADGEYAPYQIRDIVDRVGGGDSFAGGLIHALYSEDMSNPADAIRFAVAASCLKHSINGDFNYVSRAEVLALMGGDASGRVKR